VISSQNFTVCSLALFAVCVGQDTNQASLSFPALEYHGCCHDGSSRPVCSASCYTARPLYTFIVTIFSRTISLCQVSVLWNPQRYRRSQSYDSGRKCASYQARACNSGQLWIYSLLCVVGHLGSVVGIWSCSMFVNGFGACRICFHLPVNVTMYTCSCHSFIQTCQHVSISEWIVVKNCCK